MSQQTTDRSFDDLARALAEGSISRRGALKLFAGTAISALIPSRALAQSKMATICHVPPDNPANAHTITVGEAAAQRHLKQHPGDTMGSCQTSTTTSSTTSTSTSTTSTSTTTPMCLQEFGDCTSDDDCCSRICDFGICRGCQLINVAFGGSLYQDIGTQVPEALDHRDITKYERNYHRLEFVPGTGLAKLYPNRRQALINTIHHQAVDKLGRGMIVEAVAVPDGIVEAIRWRGPSYVFGVQWHPEFMFGPDIGNEHLDGTPILTEFLEAARARKARR